MNLLDSAFHLAVAAHANQMDEDGMPHIVHCAAVMSSVKSELDSKQCYVERFYTVEELLIAAILHDAVEDSKGLVTLDRIEEDFGLKVRAVVDGLTRRKDESYRDFIYRAKQNPGAKFIKIADLLHNYGRTHKIGEKKAKWRDKLQYKYKIALRVLQSLERTSWENESWEVIGDQIFIADPNGKRIEINEAQFKEIRALVRKS